MAKSEWIYDNNYKSYYYLTAEGSYARNTWAGSYYLKSDGKMAKSEWIYDSSYQSYYYLTQKEAMLVTNGQVTTTSNRMVRWQSTNVPQMATKQMAQVSG